MNYSGIFQARSVSSANSLIRWLSLVALLISLAGSTARASDSGIGAQVVPNLAFADVAPVRIFHVAVWGVDGSPGTADRPWRTINYAVNHLRPAEGAYVHAGTYYERVLIGSLASDGTATAPIHLMGAPGEPRPVLHGGDAKSGSMLRIQRSYWVVTGFDIQAAGSQAQGARFEGAHFAVVRDSEISGGTGPSGVVFHAGATDIGFLDNKVHHYTWGTSDSHGILVMPDTARIVIQGNESWANGGDSFQCQGPDATPGTTLPTDILVENNRFHEDRENAVDLKTCDRVTLRGNKFYGYRPAASAPQGAAIVIHNSARRILVEGNRMWNNGRGLTLGGLQLWPEPVTDVIIRRNLVFDSTTANGGSGDGLRVGTSRRVRIHHNTLAFLPVNGILVGDGDTGPTENAEVYNNIIYAVPRAMDLHLYNTVGFKSDRNLAYQPGAQVLFRVNNYVSTLPGWRSSCGQDASSLVTDPLFVADPRANDFYTQPGSPARDFALPLAIPAPVLNGTVCGEAADLGLLESCT
jgi:nitrous oxidase accessory protein NosD